MNADSKRNEKGDDAEHDPEEKFRIYSILSYFVVLVIFGVPIWWFTTRVYRAPLPLEAMYNVDIPQKAIRENTIPLSLDYDVLITMVHPEPEKLKVDFDLANMLSEMQPFVDMMEPVANLTMKSQWLYFVDLNAHRKTLQDHYALYEDQLPHVITPLEKKIWSHMSSRPTLNLVVYISHCHVPLYIYNNKKIQAESQALLSAPWGGIQIVNPDEKSCNAGIYPLDLQRVSAIFRTQLRRLLGLKGYGEKDIKELKKVKIHEMVESTRRTLKSLAQLLSEISSIVIRDEVAERVEAAILNADLAEQMLKKNEINVALQKAQIAFENSEKAFSDPSLLALLYFPDDQKYAVYIPLYLPIMIPVLMSLRYVKKWMQGGKLKTD